MDINGILSSLGGIMKAFGVEVTSGQAFLDFTEFWLVIFQGIGDLFSKLFGSIGGLFG